jgi:hypothetical protein
MERASCCQGRSRTYDGRRRLPRRRVGAALRNWVPLRRPESPAAAVALLLACTNPAGSGDQSASAAATSLIAVSGDHQVALLDDTLPNMLRVRAVNAAGAGVAGVDVWWSTSGDGVLLPPLAITDTHGEATARWVLGPSIGAQTATATASLQGSPQTFHATANPAANTLRWGFESLPVIPSCSSSRWSGIWAGAANDVVVVGSCGAILHFTGSGWNVEGGGATHDLYGVSGRSSGDIFAVGDSGTVLHYDGTTWTPIPGLPSNPRAKSIWASSSGDLFVGSGDELPAGTIFHTGSIWHLDNSGWTQQFVTGNCAMSGIWGASSSDVFAVSDPSSFGSLNLTPQCDQVLHYDGTTWSPYGGCSVGSHFRARAERYLRRRPRDHSWHLWARWVRSG